MSNQENSLNSLVSIVEKLQEHHKVLAKYTTGMKRRLDDLTEQFNNRPELQQLISLQDTLAQLHRQLNERSPPPEAPEEATCVNEKRNSPHKCNPIKQCQKGKIGF